MHFFETPKVYAWQGLTFETVCLTHISCIKKALGISVMATSPVVTFVTTFGIAKGMHNSVVHSEVRMEDLFER